MFERSAYLSLGGQIVALVAAELLDGPLAVRVEPAEFWRLRARQAAACDGSRITIEDAVEVDLSGAVPWDPALPAGPEPLAGAVEEARRVLLREAPAESAAHVLPVVEARDQAAVVQLGTLESRVFKGWCFVLDGIRQSDAPTLAAAASQLAGLGPGLTPAGDDVLVGTMVALHVYGRPRLAEPLVGAAERTTAVSAAYLRAAARGEASEAWHQAIAALRSGDGVETSCRRLMRFGETSGSDMLAGFVAASGALR